MGETFAGLEFNKGLELSEQLKWIAEGRGSMARAALKWILKSDAISCTIPGFKNVNQVEDNLAALGVPSYTEEEKLKLREFYMTEVKDNIRGPY